jgi:hypothetical protein
MLPGHLLFENHGIDFSGHFLKSVTSWVYGNARRRAFADDCLTKCGREIFYPPIRHQSRKLGYRFDIILMLVLIAINACFALSRIAVISAEKVRPEAGGW